MSDQEFYTFSEYMQRSGNLITSAEDYMEMIIDFQKSGFTRVMTLLWL